MAKNFKQLREKMSPEARAQSESDLARMIEELPLQALRQARDLTQKNLAEVLEIEQSEVSKIERRTDMYVSTLRRFIQAMGGQLEIRAVFPDRSVRIKSFSENP